MKKKNGHGRRPSPSSSSSLSPPFPSSSQMSAPHHHRRHFLILPPGNTSIFVVALFLLLIAGPAAIHQVNCVPQPGPGPCTLLSALPVLPAGLPPLPGLPAMVGKMKCTEKGYFELVQCFDNNYCVCVDPSTGAEASATKTAAHGLAPQCGRCHTQLARFYKDSTHFLFRPVCEPKTGNYQAKQCKDDDHCFCVNVLNGFKLSKNEAPNGQVKCEDSQFDFSIDASQVTKTETGGSGGGDGGGEQHIPIGNPMCKLPKDAGSRCTGRETTGREPIQAKGVRWYFDPDTFECLAFIYNGCGGNQNRFFSVTDCWERCKLADLAGCAGMRMPATNAQGHTIICSGLQEGAVQSCPSGYRCTMLAFMGVCCHSATQDLYERNYRPSCANGGRPMQMQAGGAPATLIGKKCSDEFCPVGTSCVEKEIFAHCCPQ